MQSLINSNAICKHILQTRTTKHTDQSLQKELANPAQEKLFFKISFLQKKFKTPTVQPTTGQRHRSLTSGQVNLYRHCNLTRRTEARTANNTLQQWRVTSKLKGFCFLLSL